MIVCVIFLFGVELFMTATKDNTSINNILTLAVIMTFIAIPPTLIYLQDKNFLDKVGSIGMELENN
jgi:hypothetical protein